MIIEPTLIAAGTVGFGLHFIGKWKETTLPFTKWIGNKEALTYWITSTLLCFGALLLTEEVAEPLGFQPITWALVVCYGGGHAVSRFLNIKQAEAERKAAKNGDA